MLIYFHRNKANYKKGQIAPFFILILVIIITMALVTLNLSKVAFIKTDTSNAVDSGGLAAGSVMANVFNTVAVSNSQMIAHYWQFYASVSIAFGIALTFLASALSQACSDPCSALGKISRFITTTMGIIVTVTAYHIAQLFFYKNIKKIALQGRRQAMEIGQRFAFINSGISPKLKEGDPPEEITEQEEKKNYRETFSDFLDDTVKEKDVQDCQDSIEYTYPWKDGQKREHSVRVIVDTEPVNRFELRVTILPLPVELGLLGASLGLAYSARGALAAACPCVNPCRRCCRKKCKSGCPCCVIWRVQCNRARGLMPAIFPLMAAAWAGLLPGLTVLFASPCGGDSSILIIAWIDEIVHNRRVRTDTWQKHQGAELGLWETKYPETYSFSIVNFEGNGKIHRPEPKFDASIEATDQIGGGK
jgi:hypothetical protein